MFYRQSWAVKMQQEHEKLSYRKLKEGERNIAIARGFSKTALTDEEFEEDLAETKASIEHADPTWEEVRLASSRMYTDTDRDRHLYFYHLGREEKKDSIGVPILRAAMGAIEAFLEDGEKDGTFSDKRRVRIIFVGVVPLGPVASSQILLWGKNWEFWTEAELLIHPNLHTMTPTHVRVPEREVPDLLKVLGLTDRLKLNAILDSDSMARLYHWPLHCIIRVKREEAFLPSVTTSHYNYRVVVRNTTEPPLQNSLDIEELFEEEIKQAKQQSDDAASGSEDD